MILPHPVSDVCAHCAGRPLDQVRGRTAWVGMPAELCPHQSDLGPAAAAAHTVLLTLFGVRVGHSLTGEYLQLREDARALAAAVLAADRTEETTPGAPR